MEFRQLLAFKIVAEQGSFTAAANALRLTQSAISQQIKALEDGCGMLLFERSSRLVRLTTAGQVLLTHTERILAQVGNARVEMAEMAGRVKGRCRRTGNTKPLFRPAAATARRGGGSPSTPRRPAAAVHG